MIQKINLEKTQILYVNGLRPCDVFLLDFKFGNSSLMTIRNYLASWLEIDNLPFSVDAIDQALSF